jgi:hypothetical protein
VSINIISEPIVENRKLERCYQEISSIYSGDIEEYESVELVETLRRYWKPKNVKTILLAESHVYTGPECREIKLPKISKLPGYPEQYAKFVYCLGYGEKKLTNNPSHPTAGTPQFWKIFYSCINKTQSNLDFSPILGKTYFTDRLENKINLLFEMKRRGIWLVDTSIIPLYRNGVKPSSRDMKSIINTSWDNYTREVVRASEPEHIIIIGKGVANSIQQNIKELVGNNYSVIAQPNAHLTADEHLENYKKYYDLCNG